MLKDTFFCYNSLFIIFATIYCFLQSGWGAVSEVKVENGRGQISICVWHVIYNATVFVVCSPLGQNKGVDQRDLYLV